MVEAHFPDTVAAAGLDPDAVLHPGAYTGSRAPQPQRSRRWVLGILRAWDECCAFCGYDGRLGSTPVGLEAAHVRWFNLGVPDELDNGLALCSLHHKLFDRGALGLSPDLTVLVSPGYTARTEASKRVYDLQGASCSHAPEQQRQRSITACGIRSRSSSRRPDRRRSAPEVPPRAVGQHSCLLQSQGRHGRDHVERESLEVTGTR